MNETAQQARLSRIRFALLLTGLAALRLFVVDTRGLWEDELYTYDIALGRPDLLSLPEEAAKNGPVRTYLRPHDPGTFASVIACVKQSPYAPLFPLLLHTTLVVAPAMGAGIIPILKLWNVLFAGLTLLALRDLCRHAGIPERVTLVASALWGLSAWDLAVSLQLRSYALGTFLTVLSMSLCLRLLAKPSAINGALLGAVLGAAVLTHYMLVILLPLNLILVLFWRRGPRALRFVGLSLGLALSMTACWLFILGPGFWRTNQNVDASPFLGLRGVPHLLADPLKRSVFPLRLGSGYPIGLDSALACVFVGIALWGILWPRTDRFARLAGVCWAGAISANVAACFVYHTNGLIWPRYLVFYLPLFWLCVASVVSSPMGSPGVSRWSRTASSVATAAVLALALLETVAHVRALRDQQELHPNELDRVTDWRQLGRRLSTIVSPDSLVVSVPSGFTVLGLQCYGPPGMRMTVWDASAEKAHSIALENRGAPIVVLFTWGQARKAALIWRTVLRGAGYVPTARVIDRSGVASAYQRDPPVLAKLEDPFGGWDEALGLDSATGQSPDSSPRWGHTPWTRLIFESDGSPLELYAECRPGEPRARIGVRLNGVLFEQHELPDASRFETIRTVLRPIPGPNEVILEYTSGTDGNRAVLFRKLLLRPMDVK